MATHKNHKGNKFSVMMDESMPMKPMMKESAMMMSSKGRKVSKKKKRIKKRKK